MQSATLPTLAGEEQHVCHNEGKQPENSFGGTSARLIL